MKNFEWIKSLSKEEMSRLLIDFDCEGYFVCDSDCDKCGKSCEDKVFEWLNEEHREVSDADRKFFKLGFKKRIDDDDYCDDILYDKLTNDNKDGKNKIVVAICVQKPSFKVSEYIDNNIYPKTVDYELMVAINAKLRELYKNIYI